MHLQTSQDAMRHIELEGCFNLRDVGGYSTSDGRATRWQALYRAGGPHALSTMDVETLDDLGLATIIDLRTLDEGSQHYATRVRAPTVHRLPMTQVLPPEDSLSFWTDPAFVADYYWAMLTEGTEEIAEVLCVLTDPSAYPVLVHCTAGKDRTGVLVAMLLGILGIADEEIVTDYALSGVAMPRLLGWMRQNVPLGDEMVGRYAPAILSAQPETMRMFIERVRATYSTFDGYTDALGLAGIDRHLRTALLE